MSYIKRKLEESGYHVLIKSLDKININLINKDDFIFYTSSDDFIIRSFIKDKLYILDRVAKIIPSYEHLMAHENKGFQQLWRDYKKFGNLNGRYICEKKDIPEIYPYVLKTIDGAGSKGVRLIENKTQKEKFEKKEFKVSFGRKIKIFHRWCFFNKPNFKEYLFRHQARSLLVTQDYIPKLKNDYKILIFGNKYYILKRDTRKNDFRASGSGCFSFEINARQELLLYAKEIYKALNAPFVSLDIAHDQKTSYLIEYQVMHFGPYTLQKSEGYYLDKDGVFTYIKEKSILEVEIYNALENYIKNHYNE